VVQKFLELEIENPDIKPNGATALIHACEHGHDDIATLLLNAKANMSFIDSNGNSTVLFASQNGHESTLRLLLAAGQEQEIDIEAFINTKNPQGWSPLGQACQQGHLNTAELLVAAKAHVTTTDNLGRLPLHLACIKGHLNIAKRLLELRPDTVNAQTVAGITPLHLAMRNTKPEIIALLKKYNADTTLRDSDGKTAFDYADGLDAVFGPTPQEEAAGPEEDIEEKKEEL
jgi:ankyrin repeat protein